MNFLKEKQSMWPTQPFYYVFKNKLKMIVGHINSGLFLMTKMNMNFEKLLWPTIIRLFSVAVCWGSLIYWGYT